MMVNLKTCALVAFFALMLVLIFLPMYVWFKDTGGTRTITGKIVGITLYFRKWQDGRKILAH